MKCTPDFLTWFSKLDRSLQIRIDQRLQRWSGGNPGQHRRFDGLLELKWKTGTMGSFRVYCAEIDGEILLLGGHKDTQSKDIEKALELLEGIKDGKTRIENYE
tara:strand:+ start:432 stop:740 length:309 start_codon:yes stop_codon:yes gene_type:complete